MDKPPVAGYHTASTGGHLDIVHAPPPEPVVVGSRDRRYCLLSLTVVENGASTTSHTVCGYPDDPVEQGRMIEQAARLWTTWEELVGWREEGPF